MLSAIAGQEVPWALAEAVFRQTEGNPLFVQEVVRYLAEEGLIAAGGRPLAAGAGVSLLETIPEGLRDVIGKRLSRLEPELQPAAGGGGGDRARLPARRRCVAVVGPETRRAELERAAGRGAEGRGAAGAGAAGAACSTASRTPSSGRRCTRSCRRRGGCACTSRWRGRWRRSTRAGWRSTRRSWPSTSRSARTRRTCAKAVQYGEVAAQRASAVYAYGEAVRLLRQALDVQEVLDPDDRGQLCQLLLD